MTDLPDRDERYDFSMRPSKTDRTYWDGRSSRLRLILESYILHAAREWKGDGLSVGIGCGTVGNSKDVVAYFEVKKGGLAFPENEKWSQEMADESFLEMAKMQWNIVGEGFRALRMDIVKNKSTQRPVRVDIYWLKGWEEGT